MLRTVNSPVQGKSWIHKIKTKRNLFLNFVLPAIFSSVTIWFWLTFRYQSWSHFIFVILWTLATILLILRALCCVRNKSYSICNFTQQIHSASRISEKLDRLKSENCHIYHNLIINGFHVNHLIISTRGIFTVTMKIYNKIHCHKFVFRQGILFFNGHIYDSLLRQMDGHAQCVHEYIKTITGQHYNVHKTAIVVGCYVENLDLNSETPEPEYGIFNENAFFGFLQKQKEVFSLEEVKQLASKLYFQQ